MIIPGRQVYLIKSVPDSCFAVAISIFPDPAIVFGERGKSAKLGA
jgi:hypothetical protein